MSYLICRIKCGMSYIIWRIKFWIRTEARPVHWIIMVLIALIVLGTDLPRLLCTFEYIDHGMTDGVHDYAYMNGNTGWDYRGRLRYFVGWAEDGRPVYAADKERTIIRKRKPWYQDMDNAMLQQAIYAEGPDFEDLLQGFCAANAGCDFIITRNGKDYAPERSLLSEHVAFPPVMTPMEFLTVATP